MNFVTTRARVTWRAICSLLLQALLWADQGLNVALGLKAVIIAAWTGEEQATCYADETLSAHAWRAEQARKPWGEFMRPVVDKMFIWQPPDKDVTAALGREITAHCEGAFLKKKLRLGLPKEYRDDPPKPAH